MSSAVKIRRRSQTLSCASYKPRVRVKFPLHPLKNLRKKTHANPNSTNKSSTSLKTSPTDSGISTEKDSPIAIVGVNSNDVVIPPDGYYFNETLDPKPEKRRVKSAPKIFQECSANSIHAKSDSGQGDHDPEDISLSLSLEKAESELQFSEHSVSPSVFDGISSQKSSNSNEDEESSLSQSLSLSSLSCSGSCCDQSQSLGTISSSSSSQGIKTPEVIQKVEKLKSTLQNWDTFLKQNGISRPDFFCRYKERQEIEKYLKKYETTVTSAYWSVKALKRRSRGRKRSFSLGENWQLRKTKDFEKYETERGRWKSTEEFDASSSNEAAHLQQKLKSLSTELVTLRNRLHPGTGNGTGNGHANANPNGNGNNQPPPFDPTDPSPEVPPHQNQNGSRHNYMNHPFPAYPNKPLPPQPTSNSNPSSQGYYENQNFQKEVLRIGSDILGVSNCSGTANGGTNGKLDVVQGIPALEEGEVPRSHGSGSGSCVVNSNSNENASGSVILGSGTNITSTPSESSFGKISLSNKSGSVGNFSKGKANRKQVKVNLADIEDLIHLTGPLTEDAILRCIQARIQAGHYSVQMGPILLLANRLTLTDNQLTLASTAEFPVSSHLKKTVQEALRQQADTGYPQALILSGVSGSGKTYTSMLILRQLFLMAGGGVGSDAFKHLNASVTVLRSLGTASTVLNRDSSRLGHFIEVQVTEGTVYRTKVHCYFLDQSRVVKCPSEEKNYHIFYQMLAGLSPDERERLHLGRHSIGTLRYLNRADPRTDEGEDQRRFLDWKTSLSMLGIPFLDVVRVLAAVILLGNVEFKDSSNNCMEMDVEGETELQSAASLLGVSESALKIGLSMRTHNLRGQLVRSRCDAMSCNFSRDALAKSLYVRTVATIVRRANSLKRLGSGSGTLSSDSADSNHNQAEVASQHASTVGTAGSKASKSMIALNAAVRNATDGFIGVLDMFGFEDNRPSHLEQLCINLCAETMQHFYNTHIFKASIESCRDEGIQCDWEVEYVDNVPCIDLISSLRTGLLSMLDLECSARGTVESYIQKVTLQHKSNHRLLPPEKLTTEFRSFAIQHYAGKVQYDATNFLDTNRDTLADDLVAVFHKHRCSFGFGSHLFSSELKVLGAGGMEPSPRGISFRISPTSHTELLNGDEPVSTLTQDFHTRLDNLLRTLVHAKPHFIRCIKMNHNETPDLFDRHSVSKQLRAFQVLETVNLMANGFPHRMRFKAFIARFRMLGPFHQLSLTEDRVIEDCQLILDSAEHWMSNRKEGRGSTSTSWALGKRHVFFSEGTRQNLESLRNLVRTNAATLIQSSWRGFLCRQRLPLLRQGYNHRRRLNSENSGIPHNSLQVPGQGSTFPSSSSVPSHHYPTALPSTKSYPQAHNMMGNTNTTQSTLTRNRQAEFQNHPFQNPQKPVSSSISPTSNFNQEPSPPCLPPPNKSGSINSATSSISPPLLPPLPLTVNGVICGSTTSSTNNVGDTLNGRSSRPQPISGTPPTEIQETCNPEFVQQTCSLFGLDMEKPPPVPPSRPYTVTGNTKLGYPQNRIMKMTYPDEGINSDIRLVKGDAIKVVGPSPRRGHLIVDTKNRTLHVPFQYLEIKAAWDP